MAQLMESPGLSYATVLPEMNAQPVKARNLMPASLRTFEGLIVRQPCFFATVPNVKVDVKVMMQISMHSLTVHRREVAMKRFFDFDAQDLAVMIGLASLSGAVLNQTSEVIFSQTLPTQVSVVVGVVAFVSGRFLSTRLRSKSNG